MEHQQTRLESFVEACLLVLVGYALNVLLGPLIYPAFGVPLSTAQNLGVAAAFTGVSVARSYAIRRFCSRFLRRIVAAVAGALGRLAWRR